MKKISVSPDGTEYFLPTENETLKEGEILKELTKKAKDEGKKVVTV